MQGFLILILLVIEVAVLSRLDRRLFGTWVTPFNVLAFPYTAVVLLAYFLAPLLDFVPPYMPSVLIWVVGLSLIWAAGVFLGWGLLDFRDTAQSRDVPPTETFYDSQAIRLATILAWIAIPVALYGTFSLVMEAGGWDQFGTEDFRGSYSYGVHAHAEVVAVLLSILLIGTYRRGRRWVLFTVGSLLLCVIASRTKGHIMEVVAGGLLLRVMRGTSHVSVKKIGLLAAITYVLFNVAYVLGMLAVSPENAFNVETYAILSRHYFFYLFAGPLALGQAIKSGVTDVGGDWTAIFAPLINLYRALLHSGSLVEAGSSRAKGMTTGLVSHNEVGVNVYTFFGTPYLYLGLLGAGLYIIVVGLLCYGLMIIAKRRRNVWLTAAYCFVAAQLSLGFFDLYFWQSMTCEIVVFGVVLSFGTRLWVRSKLHRLHRPALNF
jgi:oligosaccharide repeat unit polymerase